jgi:hypothetical protein
MFIKLVNIPAKFGVLMALTMKNAVFWNVVEICGRFGGIYEVHLTGGR